MLKKALLIISALLIIIGSYLFYSVYINPKSPKDTLSFTKNDLTINVDYSRPYKRDRLIFGNEKDNALVPFDQYWRLGANAATTFMINKDLVFGGNKLSKGKYRMYAIPGNDFWVIALNSEFDKFGYYEPNYEKDILRVNIPSIKLLTSIDQLTIDVVEDEDFVGLRIRWDKTSITIPIE